MRDRLKKSEFWSAMVLLVLHVAVFPIALSVLVAVKPDIMSAEQINLLYYALTTLLVFVLLGRYLRRSFDGLIDAPAHCLWTFCLGWGAYFVLSMAVSLLLTALGVDWPVIVENYLITNERMAASTDCLLTAVKDYDLTEAERDVIRTFDCADAEFLTAARDAAEARYGSVDAFLLQALGVGEAEREILRARWLTE